MPVLVLILAMQFVVSVKAGLINHVQGVANVKESEMARQGLPIRTGQDGYVEALLTPGSFLRLGEDSEAVLDGVELDNVTVRVVHGAAMIEVLQINKDHPLHVTSGKLQVDILKPGIYKLLDGTATVIEGQFRVKSGKTYGKGWQVAFDGAYTAQKTGKLASSRLAIYSEARSAEIARANLSMASQVRQVSADRSFWLYEPNYGMYTFMPLGNLRSPYGYRYYAAGHSDRPAYSNNNSGGYSGSAPSGNSGNANSGNANSGNTGGGGATGGNSSPDPVIMPRPEPTVTMPPPREAGPVLQPLPAQEQ